MTKISNAGGGTSGLGSFTWTTSEQVWPFEKHDDGSTLYAKQINFGSLPVYGTKNVAHGISNFNAGNDLFFLDAIRKINSTYYMQIPNPRVDNMDFQIGHAGVTNTNVYLWSGYDYSANTAIIRMIYKKSG
jgi:hypothetical protein